MLNIVMVRTNAQRKKHAAFDNSLAYLISIIKCFYFFSPLLEASAEICKKKDVVFLEIHTTTENSYKK